MTTITAPSAPEVSNFYEVEPDIIPPRMEDVDIDDDVDYAVVPDNETPPEKLLRLVRLSKTIMVHIAPFVCNPRDMLPRPDEMDGWRLAPVFKSSSSSSSPSDKGNATPPAAAAGAPPAAMGAPPAAMGAPPAAMGAPPADDISRFKIQSEFAACIARML